MRWRLPRMERERKKAIEEAFETVRRYAAKNEGGSFSAFSTLMNIGLYLLLAERDIQAVKIDALTHPDEWTRKLHARIILLTIYEWDADQVTGQTLKQALDTIQAPKELRDEAVNALRAMRGIQRKVTKQFGFVRNAAIAHREPNALVQYRAIRDLRVNDVMALAVEFYSAVDKFMPVLSKLVLASGTMPALLRQWTAKT
jgi:hypothetical protein